MIKLVSSLSLKQISVLILLSIAVQTKAFTLKGALAFQEDLDKEQKLYLDVESND